MKNYRMFNSLLFVLLLSAAPFYGSQVETNTEDVIEGVYQPVSVKDQGFVLRIYDKAQCIVTVPVNYVFGEENSLAKKTFYVVVGGSILSLGGYSLYRYFYGNVISKIEECQKQAEVKVEKLDEEAEARIVQQEMLEQQVARDLKLYRSLVASRINAQADYRAAEVKLQKLEHDWNTGGSYRYSRYADAYGNNPYYQAEIAYDEERAELSSKISNLGILWSKLTQQEAQFERNHPYISRDQFKEVEKLALGVFHRWGRSVIP